jgi:hypothetical protein
LPKLGLNDLDRLSICKLRPFCIATRALLVLALSAHASSGNAMASAAGLYSVSGAAPILLVADKTNAIDEKKTGDEKKPSTRSGPESMKRKAAM